MRRFRFIALSALIACSSNAPTAPLNRQFTLAVGDAVTVSGTPLTLRFTRVVSDSRCPLGVLCIQQGNAQIELLAVLGGSNSALTLNTTQGATNAAVGAYNVSLQSLTPFPTVGTTIDERDYRATLLVASGGIVCTELAAPALSVALQDSVTGATTGFTNVSIVARDGAYADSTFLAIYPQPPFNGPVSIAYEHRGTLNLSVQAQGYTLWTRNGIVVTGDVCHVTTVQVTARLAH